MKWIKPERISSQYYPALAAIKYIQLCCYFSRLYCLINDTVYYVLIDELIWVKKKQLKYSWCINTWTWISSLKQFHTKNALYFSVDTRTSVILVLPASWLVRPHVHQGVCFSLSNQCEALFCEQYIFLNNCWRLYVCTDRNNFLFFKMPDEITLNTHRRYVL